jgi:hypothetical protein
VRDIVGGFFRDCSDDSIAAMRRSTPTTA